MHQKSIGILQPVYLPWLGYFEQISRVDEFVFQDDAQYTKAAWRNRNRIKGPSGPVWLTVPIRRAGLHTPICEIEINYSTRWWDKHLKSLQIHYSRAPYKGCVLDLIRDNLLKKPDSLSLLTTSLVIDMTRLLGLRTSFSRSSDIARSPSVDLNGRLIEIACAAGADHIYLGAKSAEYVDPSLYRGHEIQVDFQTWTHPTYMQQYEGFTSHLSVVDAVMNMGPEATRQLIAG